jgi:putative zinc finger protein
MACKEYSERLELFEDYLSDRLSGPESAAVAAHLDTCAVCREEVNTARLAGLLLRAGLEPTSEPDAIFWTRMRAHLREEEAKQAASDFWPSLEVLARRFTLSSAVALLLLFAVMVGTEPTEQTASGTGQAEIREIIPDNTRQPIDRNEVLLSLASAGNGR